VKTSPVAVYETLCKDLQKTIERSVVYDGERVPLQVKQASAIYLQDKFLSKLIPSKIESLAADENALQAFKDANYESKYWKPPTDDASESDRQLWGSFLKICEDFFTVDLGRDVDLTWANVSVEAHCGPGASVKAQSNSHYGKLYSGPVTATDPSLVELYLADIALWPEESNAEIIRSLEFGPPVMVKGSTSCFVPKTVKTSRMIAVEPTLNMYYQLGIGVIIQKRLKRFFGIDLETQQSTNRYLAHLGSIIDSSFGDGYATIDLSSASDRLSLRLCTEVLPEEWMSTLLSLASRSTSITMADGRKLDERLHMMSTMGNGFTFPLQTALFACAAAAATYQKDNLLSVPKGWNTQGTWSDGSKFWGHENPTSVLRQRVGSFSVFGDDIIVESRVGPTLLRLLELMGSRPNPEKTFMSGTFRESCGHDYYQGYNIRPVFLRKWDCDADITVIANLLMDWSVRNEINIDSTIALCINSLKANYASPLSGPIDCGLFMPYRSVRRYGRNFNVLGLSKETQSLVHTIRVPHTRRLRFSEDSVKSPLGAKRHIYNPSGVHMSGLRGELRNHSIGLPANSTVYRAKRVTSPNWDHRCITLEDGLIGHPTGISLYVEGLNRIWDRLHLLALVKTKSPLKRPHPRFIKPRMNRRSIG